MNPEIKKVDNLHNFASLTSEESSRLENDFETSSHNQIEETNPELIEDLHKDKISEDQEAIFHQESQPSEKESKNILIDLMTDSSYRNTLIAALNALFHGLSAVSMFNNKDGDVKQKSFAEFCDKTAFLFTRWIAPLTSYAVAAIESIKDNKWIEAAIKAVPPLFLPLVGEANIDTVYGSSTGFNCPYDMVIKRIEEKSKESSDFKKYAEESSKTGMGHVKMFISEFKNMVSDFTNGKLTFEDNALLVACSAIVTGSLPIMLFMRNARDSWAARLLGLIRNAGGITGDLMFGIQGLKNKEHYKSLIGVFCTLAAGSDIAKRWVNNPVVEKILIHLGAALNVSGYAVWNAFSGSKKKAKPDEVSPILLNKDTHTEKDSINLESIQLAA
jgi:hypothetical protein